MWKAAQTTSVPATSVATTCYSLRPLSDGHTVLFYTADGASKIRGGTIHLTWNVDAGRLEWFEQTTDDVGSTAALVFSTSYVDGLISVIATSSAAFSVVMSVVAMEKQDK